MRKCSFFSQNRKLAVIVARGAFFTGEKVRPIADVLVGLNRNKSRSG